MAPPSRPNPARPIEMGLLCGGGLADSWLLRSPKWTATLGPVRGPSPAAATRAVNTLRAGRAVSSLDDFRSVSAILVAVSESLLEAALAELAASDLDWEGRTLLVASLEMDSESLRAFARRGARVATFGPVEAAGPSWFAVQGDLGARRLIRKLLGPGPRLLTVESGRKAVFLAGLTLAASLVAPVLTASAECLTAAGLAPVEASAVSVASLETARRAFAKAGRKGWQGDLASRAPEEIVKQWQAVAAHDPATAELFADAAQAAAALMKPAPDWAKAFARLRQEHLSQQRKR